MHERIRKAREYSLKAHGNQTYGDIYPYYKHLEDVDKILELFGYTEDSYLDLRVAAFFHDIMEDTSTSYSDIKILFGETIAEMVYCMTDERGRNRKEKKEKTYPKIRSNPNSIILKLADRIANVEFSLTQSDKGFFEMYKKEYTEFEYNLRIHNHCDAMWDYLHSLLFKEEANALRG